MVILPGVQFQLGYSAPATPTTTVITHSIGMDHWGIVGRRVATMGALWRDRWIGMELEVKIHWPCSSAV